MLFTASQISFKSSCGWTRVSLSAESVAYPLAIS